MAKTLTVTIAVPLPDDHFAAAEIMAAVKAPLDSFKSAMPDNAVVKAEVVTQRKAKEPGAAPRRRPGATAATGE